MSPSKIPVKDGQTFGVTGSNEGKKIIPDDEGSLMHARQINDYI